MLATMNVLIIHCNGAPMYKQLTWDGLREFFQGDVVQLETKKCIEPFALYASANEMQAAVHQNHAVELWLPGTLRTLAYGTVVCTAADETLARRITKQRLVAFVHGATKVTNEKHDH